MCCIACSRNYQQVRRSRRTAATSTSAEAGSSSVTTRVVRSNGADAHPPGCRDRKGVAVVVWRLAREVGKAAMLAAYYSALDYN